MTWTPLTHDGIAMCQGGLEFFATLPGCRVGMKAGDTVDFLLTVKRDLGAARRFL
jgi:hypothetical protein